jgi:hypothetical protein
VHRHLTPENLLIGAVVVAALLPLRALPAVRRPMLDRLSRRMDLPVPPGLRGWLEAAATGRALAAGAGVVAGLAVAAAVAAAFGLPGSLAFDTPSASMWPLAVFGAAIAGAAVGAAAWGTRRALRDLGDEEARVARPTALGMGDYVDGVELWGSRLAAVAPVVMWLAGMGVAAVTPAATVGEVVSIGALVAAALPLVALAAAELAGRRLLELPQAAGSPLELAWHDSLRSKVLRDVISAPLCAGVFATLGLLIVVAGSLRDGVLANGVIGLVGLFVIVLVVIAMVSGARRPHRHFRRQLWRGGEVTSSTTVAGPGGGPSAGGMAR